MYLSTVPDGRRAVVGDDGRVAEELPVGVVAAAAVPGRGVVGAGGVVVVFGRDRNVTPRLTAAAGEPLDGR